MRSGTLRFAVLLSINPTRIVKGFIVICYWTKNPAIVIRYCFKIKSVIYYKTKKML